MTAVWTPNPHPDTLSAYAAGWGAGYRGAEIAPPPRHPEAGDAPILAYQSGWDDGTAARAMPGGQPGAEVHEDQLAAYRAGWRRAMGVEVAVDLSVAEPAEVAALRSGETDGLAYRTSQALLQELAHKGQRNIALAVGLGVAAAVGVGLLVALRRRGRR